MLGSVSSGMWHGWATRSQDAFRALATYYYVDSRAAQGLETPPMTSTWTTWPRHTWLRTITQTSIHPLNHGLILNSAWRLAQGRERWRQLVETATLHWLQIGARSWWWWLMMLERNKLPAPTTFDNR